MPSKSEFVHDKHCGSGKFTVAHVNVQTEAKDIPDSVAS